MRRILLPLLAACTLLSAAASARPARKGKPAPAAPAAPEVPAEPPPPVEVPPVPPLVSSRVDGLRVVVQPVQGPAVLFRLVLDLEGLKLEHTLPGVTLVTGAAALNGGPMGQALATGGAGTSVDVVDNALVLGVDTLRERWKDDLVSLLGAVSAPTLVDAEITAGAAAVAPVGRAAGLDALFRALAARAVEPDGSLVPAEASGQLVNREAAAWNMEEAWASDRMTLVVLGAVDEAEVQALVEKHFLVPAAVPGANRVNRESPRPLHEDEPGIPPGHVAYGAYAHGLPPEDVLVLAEVLNLRMRAESPAAGACDVRYVPSARRPILVAACTAVRGTALDVRETLGRLVDPSVSPAPTPDELQKARRMAAVRLAADRASAPRMSRRLVGFSLAGLDARDGLERSVAGTQDPRLLETWQALLAPERFIRLHRKAKQE